MVTKLASSMTIYDLELHDWQKLLQDQPHFRTTEIWRALHQRGIRPQELTSLPKHLRIELSETNGTDNSLSRVRTSTDSGNLTEKALFRLGDGQLIETVLMHYPDRSTVCISSQAGCAMNCGFCATGQHGFFRNLTLGEIVEQVAWALRRTLEMEGSRRLTNIVFMGMGEPLANSRKVLPAIERINDNMGIGARHITLSTVGIIPGIKLVTNFKRQINLAVSLHAANNEKRSSLIPINNRYPIEDLSDSLMEYSEKTHRRVSFEWAMIKGLNDTDQDVAELIRICIPLRAHVNLIPLNPTPGWPALGSSLEKVKRFARLVKDGGVAVSIRDNRGTDIDAACGQLAGLELSELRGERITRENSARIRISEEIG